MNSKLKSLVFFVSRSSHENKSEFYTKVINMNALTRICFALECTAYSEDNSSNWNQDKKHNLGDDLNIFQE